MSHSVCEATQKPLSVRDVPLTSDSCPSSFFLSPDETELWTVYTAYKGSSVCTARMHIGAKRLDWNPDGTPNFGTPGLVNEPVDAPSGE